MLSKKILSYLCFSIVFSFPLLALSEIPGTYRGSGSAIFCTDQNPAACVGAIGRPVIAAELEWNAGLLIGEPVINMQVAWKPNQLTKHVAPIYSKADSSLGLIDPMLGMGSGSEAAKQLRLYDVQARLTLYHGNRRFTLDVDAGVPGAPGGEKSFNVPGAPDWNKLLRDNNGNFVSAELAREIVASGAINNAEATLTKATVDTSRFENWWLAKNVDRYTDPLKSAIDDRLKALETIFDLPTADIRKEIEQLKTDKPVAMIGKLEAILFKLDPDQIPQKFLGEGPQRLERLHRYAQWIESNNKNLLEKSEGLPPMPGTSDYYDNWYQKVQGRMQSDALRLATLQQKADDIARLEREIEEAKRKEQLRAERRAEKQRIKELKRKQQEEQERRRRELAYESSAAFSYDDGTSSSYSYGAVIDNGFQDSGWGADSYRFNPSYWAADGYISDPCRETKGCIYLTIDEPDEPTERMPSGVPNAKISSTPVRETTPYNVEIPPARPVCTSNSCTK